MSFSELSIIKSFNRKLVIVVLKWFLINFNLLKHRSFEAVVTGDVNAKRQSSLAGLPPLKDSSPGDRPISKKKKKK